MCDFRLRGDISKPKKLSDQTKRDHLAYPDLEIGRQVVQHSLEEATRVKCLVLLTKPTGLQPLYGQYGIFNFIH